MIPILFLAQLILFALGILGPWRDAPALKTVGRLPRPIRMLLSASLVLAAFVLWSRGARYAAYAQWVACGMLASFIGDLVMAKLIPLPNRLIGGMVAFGLAHALYITAYVQTGGAALVNVGLVFGAGVYALVSLGGWWFLIRNPAKALVVNLGALGYGLCIGAMAAGAFALAVALGGAFWLAALGGALFVASDFLIGVTDIRGIRIANANDWIWLTYVAGQMGIIYASALVVP